MTSRAVFTVLLAAPVLFGAAFSAVPTAAQTPAPMGQTTTPVGLNLSADQRAKADARQAQFKKDVEALRTDTKLTDAQKQAKYTSLYQSMDTDMMAILTPAQRSQVQKQRQVNDQFKASVLALEANKKLTDAQKKARYVKLVENARNASLALMTPAQRAEAIKRSAQAEQAQQAQDARIAEAKRLSQQLQKSQTPAQSQKLGAIALTAKTSMQSVIADKTLSDTAKTDKIVALRKDALNKDLALLTPAQRALYERIQALISAPPAH